MYKAAPHTKWYPDPSNHRAEAEESCALQPPFFPCDRQEAGSAQTIQELQQNWNSIPETCDSKNQGLNLGLLHCRQVLYPPRNLGNLRISITLWLMHHAVPSTDCTALPTQWSQHLQVTSGSFLESSPTVLLTDSSPTVHLRLTGQSKMLLCQPQLPSWGSTVSVSTCLGIITTWTFMQQSESSCVPDTAYALPTFSSGIALVTSLPPQLASSSPFQEGGSQGSEESCDQSRITAFKVHILFWSPWGFLPSHHLWLF